MELLHREEESWDAEGEGRKEEAERVAGGGDGGDGKGERSVDIIRWWGRMNLVRAALPLVGSLLAFEAL